VRKTLVLEEGVYIYVDGKPQRISSLSFENGKYIVFFDNRKCPFCRIFDVMWDLLVKDQMLSDIKFVKVVCSYFASDCVNEEAKKAYTEHEIWKSPTVMLVEVTNSEKRISKFTPSQYNYDLQLIKKAILNFFQRVERDANKQ
jgi:hypothetical protein